MRNGKQLTLGWLDSNLGNTLSNEQIETSPKSKNPSNTAASGVLSMAGHSFVTQLKAAAQPLLPKALAQLHFLRENMQESERKCIILFWLELFRAMIQFGPSKSEADGVHPGIFAQLEAIGDSPVVLLCSK